MTKLTPLTIVARRKGKFVAAALQRLIRFLQDNSLDFSVDRISLDEHGLDFEKKIDLHQVTSGLLLSIGGDGSMLKLVEQAVLHNLPILGINCGKVGFLADLSIDNLQELKLILQGRFKEEQRSLLIASWEDEGKTYTTPPALNEVTIARENITKMLDYSIYVHDTHVARHSADGLIVATSTGSSAYALSSGGPMITPSLPAHIIVPICTHKLSSRPLVIPDQTSVNIKIYARPSRRAVICIDGHDKKLLPDGVLLKIKKASPKLRLIHPKKYDFFTTLHNKLHWEKEHYAQETDNS